MVELSALSTRLNSIEKSRLASGWTFRWGAVFALATCVLLAAIPAGAVPDTVLYDGEPGGSPLPSASCVEYVSETTAESYSGLQSLLLEPSPWHRPKLILYCDSGGRRNLSGYDAIDFYTRAADPLDPVQGQTLYLTKWDQASNEIAIADYIEGGVLDGTWRKVTIPIADLQTQAWDLSDVEMFHWSVDALYRQTYVDDIAARDTTPVEVSEVIVESNRYTRLRFSERYNTADAGDPARYTLLSSSDPAYASPRTPVDAGLEWRTVDFAGGVPSGVSGAPVVIYDVTLQWPEDLLEGHAYQIDVDGIRDEAGNSMIPSTLPLGFDPEAPNPNVKIDQVGYRPNDPKVGFVGGYLGDLGGGIWVVGESGMVARWHPRDGWTVESVGTENLRGVAIRHASDAWVVGDGGSVRRFDGAAWQEITVPATVDLNDISFTDTLEGWIVGDGGLILHRSAAGESWQVVASGTSQNLAAVFAINDSNALAVGDAGTLLDWDGSSWTETVGVTSADLLDVGGFPYSVAWAIGRGGAFFERKYGQWQERVSPQPVDLWKITGDPHGGAVAVGDNGTIVRRSGSGYDVLTLDPSPGVDALSAIAFLDNRRGMALGPAGLAYVYDSNAGGWSSQAAPLPGAVLDAMALPYGPLRTDASSADIVDTDTDSVVLTVPIELHAANWHLSGEDVYGFDFSALVIPGTYVARVEGFGTSDPFVVADDVYDPVVQTTGRALYHQRCGTDLVGTTHPHDACHVAPAQYHASVAASALYAGETVGGQRDVSGGWHDAGDYNKYIPTGATALWYLLAAFDLGSCDGPTHADDWGLPESGNGVPDLLDEARWELDWLVRLQEADGGFPNKVTTSCWVGGMPETSTETQYILEKTTHDTASAAAVLAMASRIFSAWDGDLAETYLEAARSAWTFLVANPSAEPAAGFVNPSGVCTGSYQDPLGDDDERAWAAAELFRTTGEVSFRDAFATHWAMHPPLWGWNTWQHHQREASWAYANSPHASVDETSREEIRQAFVTEADVLVSRTESSPYRSGSRLDVPVWIAWGSFAHSTDYAFQLLQAYSLTEDPVYRDSAARNLHVQLGANPLSLSFITGTGARSPRDPLQKPSMYDGIEEPVPGIPVFGTMTVLSNANPYDQAVQADENSYPWANGERDPYPPLRRYVDSNELVSYSEFTVLELARTVGALAVASRDPSGCTGTSGPCSAINKPRIIVARLDRPSGEQKIKLGGTFTRPYPFIPELDPAADGVRVFLRDAADDDVVSATIPAGLFDPATKEGWKTNSKGTSAKWSGSSLASGINRVVLRWGRSSDPGQIKFKIVGRQAAATLYPQSLPLTVEIRLDTEIEPSAHCGDADFSTAGHECVLKASLAKCR